MQNNTNRPIIRLRTLCMYLLKYMYSFLLKFNINILPVCRQWIGILYRYLITLFNLYVCFCDQANVPGAEPTLFFKIFNVFFSLFSVHPSVASSVSAHLSDVMAAIRRHDCSEFKCVQTWQLAPKWIL